MLDFNNSQRRIAIVDQEDRALLRSNPSAWSMPEDGQEHIFYHMLLPSRSSFGCKAINLLSWCEAPTKVKLIRNTTPVGHMSVLSIRCLISKLLGVSYGSDRTFVLDHEQFKKGNPQKTNSVSRGFKPRNF